MVAGSLAVIAFALPALHPSAAGAEGRACAPAQSSLPVSFGLPPDDEGSGPEDAAPGLVTGLGTRGSTVEVRTTRRRGRIRSVELCADGGRLARLPRPDRRARLTGASVNGRYVAWRTSGPGARGTLRVGRVRGGSVVAVRTTTNAALRRSTVRSGRLLVMPDGTTAWSLPENGRAGVWLWPSGRGPRRIASLSAADVLDTSVDVRILDDRNVLLPGPGRVVRYGPATPGVCPRAYAAPSFALGPLRLATVGVYTSSGNVTEVAELTAVCDTKIGAYRSVYASTRSSSSPYGVGLETAVRTYRTAGVVVTLVASSSGPGTTVERYHTVVHRFDGSAFPSDGSYLGRDAIAAIDPATFDGGPPALPQGARMVPGAVAWVATSDRLHVSGKVWLADAAGTRVVGGIPPTAVGKPEDATLRLDPGALTWLDGTQRRSVPVAPVPGDPLDVATPPD
jgi:hypothetical protein